MIDSIILLEDTSIISKAVLEQLSKMQQLPSLKLKSISSIGEPTKNNEILFIISNDYELFLEYKEKVEIKNLALISSSLNNKVSVSSINSAIGLQRHLITEATQIPSHNLFLGDIRKDITICEPLIREADTLIVNVDVMRKGDIENYKSGHPSGLFTEDVTQLFRYAGMSESNRMVWLQNFKAENADLIAQFIWYYLEAAINRIPDHPYFSNSVNEYVVTLDSIDEPLSFFKSKSSGRWWVKVPKIKENKWRACSYEDYQAACQDEISDALFDSLIDA